ACAGPGSGPERKQAVYLGGAIKLIRACQATGVGRYLMVSAMGAADPAYGPEAMQPYLKAKAGADNALCESGLAYTIVRPGRLTDEPATGSVRIGEGLERGEVAREDVAAVLAACLDQPTTQRRTFDLVAGPTPIAQALAAL
ncbi:MAG: NAD(P)H-binding protein, partial [Solirubrobacteraceae bacterium]